MRKNTLTLIKENTESANLDRVGHSTLNRGITIVVLIYQVVESKMKCSASQNTFDDTTANEQLILLDKSAVGSPADGDRSFQTILSKSGVIHSFTAPIESV